MNVIGVTVSMVFRLARGFRIRLVLSGAQLESNQVGLSFRTLPRSRTLWRSHEASTRGRLGRSRGGYRGNLDRVRRGRRDTGRDSRRRAGHQRERSCPRPSRSTKRSTRSSPPSSASASRSTAARTARSPSTSRSPGCCRAGFRRRSTARARSGRASTARTSTAPVSCPHQRPRRTRDLTKNVPWLKLVGTPMPNTTRRVQQCRVHSADRHARGRRCPREHARRRRPWPSTTPPTTCSGRPSKESQHRVAPRLPSETERGPASNQSTPATLQRPCKAGSA